MNIFTKVDINESLLLDFDRETFNILLKDRTTDKNIMWCTNNYVNELGENYAADREITIDSITGKYESTIVPRAFKTREEQKNRTREKAEVFTPSWVCNAQNNLIDTAWFGREGVFNTENDNHTWTVTEGKITFPKGKTWQEYVKDIRMEITCGEAPYIVSRYDTTTGKRIPVKERIGLLDRKLRVINENVDDHRTWLIWVKKAYMSIYGYEWQGDNLLLAREALLQTLFEYHDEKFHQRHNLRKDSVRIVADIISWNLWQMDGLRGVIPNSCGLRLVPDRNLYDYDNKKILPCRGCNGGNINEHNGIHCKIKDWKEKKEIFFINLIKKTNQ